MNPDDISKSALVIHSSPYERLVMPFGLKNAPETFQRAIKAVIKKHQHPNFVNHIDDIAVRSTTYKEHLEHLDGLLTALNTENIKHNLKKCQFARTHIDYLRHAISKGNTSPIKNTIDAIHKFPKQWCIKDMHRFIGAVNMYKRYIGSFSNTSFPLTELLDKYAIWHWSPACEEAVHDW